MPGQGCHYWTARYGQYWVSGGVYQTYAAHGYECGILGPPVKAYGWIQEMNYGRGCWGQWFYNGAIGYHDGRWNVMLGRYGQSSLRRTLRHPIRSLRSNRPRAGAEMPPDGPFPIPVPVPEPTESENS